MVTLARVPWATGRRSWGSMKCCVCRVDTDELASVEGGNVGKKRTFDQPAPQVPSQAEKAKPHPAEAIPPATGPEMELEVAPLAPESSEGVTPEEVKRAEEESGSGSPFPIVGIGASAGGLEASTELLRHLPDDTGMAFVFIHHLAPEHESLLVEILGRATPMPVQFARDGLRVEPNHVYVSPPNAYLAVFHGTLNLMRQEPGPTGRNSIDYFLRSLAEDQRSRSIGVVLSGTGSDGALGVRAIKAEDGIAIAQEPKSAAYDGMPRAAVETTMVDFVLSPAAIAAELARIAKHPYVGHKEAIPKPLDGADDREILDRIFLMLRTSAGVDFSFYKPTTVKRRIGRRMVIHHVNTLKEYLKILEDNPDETISLHQDLLINVTGFFREPEAFEALKTQVFPQLMDGRGQYDSFRIWVPACSTGEEAYSLAIVLNEFLETQKVKPPIQIFATDVSDTSIEKARTGFYPENIVAEVSPERLSRFFTRTEGGYQINKSIRDTCVFAKHDVTRDPPFSRLDLISCRNLLIYLGQVLQRRLIPVFHYALNSNGFLLLGSSESVGEYGNLFTLIDQKVKIFAKKPVAARPPMEFGFRQYPIGDVPPSEERVPPPAVGRVLSAQKEADRIAMERFVPPGVLVDDQMQILQFRGDTTPYLRHAPGRATLDLLDMARDGLSSALKGFLAQQRQSRTTVRIDGVRVKQNGSFRTVDLEIVPLPRIDDRQHRLIFFREPSESEVPSKSRKAKGTASEAKETDILRRELADAREQLRLTVEDKDAAVEGLRAANEEIQSSNEELQSINEELETAKEELQSTNEELTTLNEELQNRNFELLSTNDDLRNVLASVNIPIIILGKDLRIRRYTPMAERVLNLIPSDIGRPVTDLKLKVEVPDLEGLVRQVIEDLTPVDRDVTDESNRSYRLQLRPYRTAEDRIEGAIIAMLDVSGGGSGDADAAVDPNAVNNVRALSRAVLDNARDATAVVSKGGKIEQANAHFSTLFDASEPQLVGKSLFKIGRGALETPELHAAIDEAFEQGTAATTLDVTLPGIGERRFTVALKRVDLHGQRPQAVMCLTPAE